MIAVKVIPLVLQNSVNNATGRIAYGAGPGGVVHVDSYGLVAVALPGGRADAAFGLAEGTPVTFGMAR